MRDHKGDFIAGKNLRLPGKVSVFEAEAMGVREALSWIGEQNVNGATVVLELDSLLTMQAVNGHTSNLLEVGEVIENCKMLLRSLDRTYVCFVRKLANKVAHEIAKIPCLVNHHNVFTSPPACVLETLLFDFHS